MSKDEAIHILTSAVTPFGLFVATDGNDSICVMGAGDKLVVEFMWSEQVDLGLSMLCRAMKIIAHTVSRHPLAIPIISADA